MDDAGDAQDLGSAITRMRKPMKGIAFATIVKLLSDQNVIRIDHTLPADQRLIAQIRAAIALCTTELARQPIRRSRPNEVGGDLEGYVLQALLQAGLVATRPTAKSGIAKASGYPDILMLDDAGRPTYLECKMFAFGRAKSAMRSFYLSPSETFKVSHDARHLLLAFGMETQAIAGSRIPAYMPRSYRLVDLHDLICDVKYEFNSDNRRLYAQAMTLSYGRC